MTARAKTPASSELSLTVSKLSLDLIRQWCCMDFLDRATYWRGLCVYRNKNKYKGPVYYLILHASASNSMMLKTSHQAFRVGEQPEEEHRASALPDGSQQSGTDC